MYLVYFDIKSFTRVAPLLFYTVYGCNTLVNHTFILKAGPEAPCLAVAAFPAACCGSGAGLRGQAVVIHSQQRSRGEERRGGMELCV